MVEALFPIDSLSRRHAMSAPGHLARYHCVRGLCNGKRVLDVACGEGYGSSALAEWGATEVVGVDASAEAIASAQKEFGSPKLRFLRGDPSKLDDIVGDGSGFDLIVSFDAIAHVVDAFVFLCGLRRQRAEGGAVIISCPNASTESKARSSYVRGYTFDEFREVTTAVFGAASDWLLGAPAYGELLYPSGEGRVQYNDDGPLKAPNQRSRAAGDPPFPTYCNVAPRATTHTFYMGCWGAPIQVDAVLSPHSHPPSADPWRTIALLKQERDEALACHGDLSAAKRDADRQLAGLRHRVLAHARSEASAIAEARRLQAELEQWRVGRRSRSYAAIRLYLRGYTPAAVVPMLQWLRRAAGMVMRR